MILLIIFLPLIGSVIAGLFTGVIGRKGAAIVTTGLMCLNVSLTCYLFYKISISERLYFIKMATWINSELFQIDW
jgi:NADH-quinone oxidoreductase subunit L